jgi:hypothetical protein
MAEHGAFVNFERIKEALTRLDTILNDTCPHDAKRMYQNQEAVVQTLVEGSEVEYYLHSGYSRIWLDPVEGNVFVTSNSSDKVKERWNSLKAQLYVVVLKEELSDYSLRS